MSRKVDVAPEEMTAEEYRIWIVKQMDEKSWQDWIIREATDHGWKTYHTHNSRRSQPGYPDLAMVHPDHGYVLLELKREPTPKNPAKLRPEQRQWLALLQRVGQRAYLARPRDIERVTRLIAGEDVWIGPRIEG